MTALQEVCHLITDGKHGDCRDENNSGYYFISCKDVKDGWIDYRSARQITKDDFLDTHCRTQLDAGDIVITNSGTIGRMAIVPDTEITKHTTFQKSVAIIKPKKDKVVTTWLYYYLNVKKENLVSWAGGTAQKNLLLRDLRAYKLLIPPRPTQQKIAAILSAYDDLIENNTRRIRILEEMAQAIYREWFVNFRFPGHEGVRMVESELGLVPEGWGFEKIENVSVNFDNLRKPLSTMERENRQGSFPYYGAQGIIDHIDDFKFNGDFLLVPEDGANLLTRNLPIVYIAKGKFWVNNHAHVIKSKSPYSLEYLFMQLTNSNISGFITGTAQPKLNQENFNKIPILAPTSDILIQFNLIIFGIFEKISLLLTINQNLRRTRDLLLPKLISGELDVNELDIEIPAA